jgi:hypothetical protein
MAMEYRTPLRICTSNSTDKDSEVTLTVTEFHQRCYQALIGAFGRFELLHMPGDKRAVYSCYLSALPRVTEALSCFDTLYQLNPDQTHSLDYFGSTLISTIRGFFHQPLLPRYWEYFLNDFAHEIAHLMDS